MIMENSNESQFDENVFEKVITEFVKTLPTGEIYVAKDKDSYFTYIVPFIHERLKGTRQVSLTKYRTIIQGKSTVLDTYRVQNGKTFQVGYYSRE